MPISVTPSNLFSTSQECAYYRLNQSEYITVIELSGVQFGPKLYAWFQNQTNAQHEFDLKSQVWFQTELHDTKFNYHSIKSILKSQN